MLSPDCNAHCTICLWERYNKLLVWFMQFSSFCVHVCMFAFMNACKSILSILMLIISHILLQKIKKIYITGNTFTARNITTVQASTLPHCLLRLLTSYLDMKIQYLISFCQRYHLICHKTSQRFRQPNYVQHQLLIWFDFFF